MKLTSVAHTGFTVSNLDRSLAFYRDLLGFHEVGRTFGGAAAALTSGRTHHELLLIEVGAAPAPPSGRRLGLYHIGIRIGDSLDELRAAKAELEGSGIAITGGPAPTGPVNVEAYKSVLKEALRHANKEIHTFGRTPGKGGRTRVGDLRVAQTESCDTRQARPAGQLRRARVAD